MAVTFPAVLLSIIGLCFAYFRISYTRITLTSHGLTIPPTEDLTRVICPFFVLPYRVLLPNVKAPDSPQLAEPKLIKVWTQIAIRLDSSNPPTPLE